MEIKKLHWFGIGVALAIMLVSLLLINTRFFFFIFGMGILLGALPFVISIVRETRIASEKEEMFLEFARNLVESVKTGTPVSKSIIQVKGKYYGVLSENIKKLANQISVGIPLSAALQTFANDVKNKTISRSLTLIGQAEKSGGEIGGILESVAEAVSTTDKLKKERKAGISTLIVQGYIIFVVFIIIILVLQFQIIPLLGGIASPGGGSGGGGLGGVAGFIGGGGGAPISQSELSNAFLYLLLIQGFFSGLTIGKLSEGTIKPGIKHSFILMVMAFVIFMTFIFFIYLITQPALKTERKDNSLEFLARGLTEKSSGNLTAVSVAIVPPGPPQDCVRLSGFFSTTNVGNKIIARDNSGNTLQSSVDVDDLLVVRNGVTFFKVYGSEEFAAAATGAINPCPQLSQGSGYVLGLVKTDESIFQTKIVKLIENYSSNYDGLKDDLKISQGNEFDFSFTYGNGTEISTQSKNQTISSNINIYAKDVPIR